MATAPLPIRDGLDPTRVRMPQDATESTVLEYLVERFPRDAERLREKAAAGEIVDARGRPIDATTPLMPRVDYWLYRDPPVEPVVPFDIEILYRDRDILVVDKPHFLATTPRGAYIARSALVRLRRDLDIPELSPAHRLDRLTAGVLLLTVRPQVRRAYQELFAQRAITKTYDAVARFDPHLVLPVEVRSRIVKERGVLKAQEVSGVPNAETLVQLQDSNSRHGLYRLTPRTGKTHQLRLHMSSLGVPIVGDNFYPEFYDVGAEDYSTPLQLLARSLEFTDPYTDQLRRFESERRLHLP